MTKPSPVGLSASMFAASTLITGCVLSWITSYVFAPLEEKWRQAPEIPFQLGLVFTVFLTAIGGLLFAAIAAAVSWGRAYPPASRWRLSAIAGLSYAGVVLGGAEYSDRILVWHLPVAVFWSLVFILPALFAIIVWRGGRGGTQSPRAG